MYFQIRVTGLKMIIIHQKVFQQYKIHTHQTVWLYHQSLKLANIILHHRQTIILRLHLWLALMMNHQKPLNHQEHISKPLYQWIVLLFWEKVCYAQFQNLFQSFHQLSIQLPWHPLHKHQDQHLQKWYSPQILQKDQKCQELKICVSLH